MGLERRVAADASDAERGEKEGSSERELLVAVSTRMASKEQEAEKDDIADAQQKGELKGFALLFSSTASKYLKALDFSSMTKGKRCIWACRYATSSPRQLS